MAEFTITITERLKVREATPEDQLSLWGTMVWGTNGWYGDAWDTIVDFDQWLANTLSLADNTGKSVEKGFAETVTLSDAVGKNVTLDARREGVSLSGTWAITRSQGDWDYKTDDTETWIEKTADTESWAEKTDASTSWSET